MSIDGVELDPCMAATAYLFLGVMVTAFIHIAWTAIHWEIERNR